MNRRDRIRLLATVYTFLLMALAPSVLAQTETIYRWTDDRGVVHFGHLPPAGQNAEERHMRKRPTPKVEEAEEKKTDEDDEKSASPANDDDAKPDEESEQEQSSSSVILDNDETALVGGAVQRFTGRVKNLGNAIARDVAVDILVAADNRVGDECLRYRAAVTPAVLAPGASGTYAVEIENPCFAGGTRADVQARWN